MEDINYEQVFDVNAADASEGESTAPVSDSADEAVQDDTTPASDNAPDGENAPKTEMSREERARQAEGRRIREREERARKEERDRASGTIQRLGILNPKTQKPIASLDELEAYERDLSEARLREGNATGDDVRRVVREEMARRDASEPSNPTSAVDDPRIQAELAQIRELDPEAGDLSDILRGPYGQRFRELVQRGNTFIDAYKLAAEDRLATIRAGRATEAARVKAASKDHLSATATRGQGAASVPSDEMAMFRVFMPDATEAEIQRYYAADQKKFKK